jgi:hypothetical protein
MSCTAKSSFSLSARSEGYLFCQNCPGLPSPFDAIRVEQIILQLRCYVRGVFVPKSLETCIPLKLMPYGWSRLSFVLGARSEGVSVLPKLSSVCTWPHSFETHAIQVGQATARKQPCWMA